MNIVKIEPLGKRRYRIDTDEEISFVLYGNEIRTYKIEEGNSLPEETYKRIIEDVLVKRARLRSMNLLMKHSFTERQLRDKLIDGGYPPCIVDNAVEYVISFGYVNDEAYARDFVFSHSLDKSITRIRYDLANKGVDREIINKVLTEVMDSDSPVDEEQQIHKLLQKKHYNSEEASFDEKQKICAYLMRRGFSGDLIRRIINSDFDYNN